MTSRLPLPAPVPDVARMEAAALAHARTLDLEEEGRLPPRAAGLERKAAAGDEHPTVRP